MQLIVVFETNKKAETDRIYFRAYFNALTGYDDPHSPFFRKIKWDEIFAKSKGNMVKEGSKIKELQKMYLSQHPGEQSFVVLCADTDYGRDGESENEKIAQYCRQNGYIHVWFHRVVEEVFLGHEVSKNEKTKAAKRFERQKHSDISNEKKFFAKSYQNGSFGSSNVGCVLNGIVSHEN